MNIKIFSISLKSSNLEIFTLLNFWTIENFRLKLEKKECFAFSEIPGVEPPKFEHSWKYRNICVLVKWQVLGLNCAVSGSSPWGPGRTESFKPNFSRYLKGRTSKPLWRCVRDHRTEKMK